MSFRRWLRDVCVLGAVALLVGCGEEDGGATANPYPMDSTLRLNQIQVVGSHNSFKIEPRPKLLAALKSKLGSLADGFEYSHKPLDVQFETQGIRQIELDIFADPQGGKYASRAGLRFIGENPASGIPALSQPGLKVLHVQDIDFEVTCYTFVECLGVVKRWSDAHPLHLPIMILVEAKEDIIPVSGAAIPLPFGVTEVNEIDTEIRSVFPTRQLILPDDIRRNHETLEEAVRTDGWPTLAEARGRIMFCLDNGGTVKANYIQDHPSLRGRILFTSSEPGEPEAAFVKLNDSFDDFDEIQRVVRQGFVVRSRADGDTVEARANDTRRRDRAILSGAQWVSTDYRIPDPRFGNDYHVEFAGGLAVRCNPLNAPVGCTPSDIESPQHLQ